MHSMNVIMGSFVAVCLLFQDVALSAGRRQNFLETGPSAAATSLGGAVIASGIDSSAGFYNPATLVGQPSSVLLEYSQPNTDANRSWLGFAIGDQRLKTGMLWKHESLPLSSSKDGFLMSVGVSDRLIKYVPKGISLGLTLGYVQESISGYSASSFLANCGAAYTRSGRRFRYGIGTSINNLYFSGLQFRADGEKELWPKELNIGTYISRWGFTLFNSVKVGSQMTPGIGLIFAPVPFMQLRAGMNGNPRLGAGFEIRKFKLDYAMTLGELKNANTMTLSYLWGKAEKEKDYTNPLYELTAQYEALAEPLLTELKNTAQSGEVPEIFKVFRLLAVDMKSEDGWSFFSSLTGGKKLNVRMPFFRQARRHYLEFAVAYANDAPNAKDLAEQFIARYPKESASKLIRVILGKDPRWK